MFLNQTILYFLIGDVMTYSYACVCFCLICKINCKPTDLFIFYMMFIFLYIYIEAECFSNADYSVFPLRVISSAVDPIH